MTDLITTLFTDGLIYLLLYLWLFVIALIEACKEFKKYNIVFATITFFLLSFFTGLRWEVGTDWGTYKELFDSLELNWTFVLNVYSFDLGYVLFNAIIKYFTDSYTILLLIDSFLAVGLVYIFLLKYSPHPNLSFFVFYNSFFVSQFMGSNRRIISLAAALFAFYYIYTGRKKLFVLWETIAFLFHRSSIIIALTFLMPKKRFNNKQIIFILTISLLIGLPQLPFKVIGFLGNTLANFSNNPIIEKMLFYSTEHTDDLIGNTNPAVQIALSIVKRSIFLIFYLIIIKSNSGILDPLSDYFFNLYIVGFATYILLNGSPIFQMVSTYFTFIEIALIGRFWIYASKRLRLNFLCILLVYGFFQLLSALNAYPELFMPYKTTFSQIF